MYRIISGKWKGRRISAPKNLEVRPTTDFAKEALFNIIENRIDIRSCHVLDLFAGIGSITLEMESRGALSVTAVESNAKNLHFIRKKSEELQAEHIQCISSDVFIFLQRNRASYELIFADPPFHFEWEQYERLHQTLMQSNSLTPGGLFILEHQSKVDVSSLSGFEEKRTYGNIAFSFFTF